jgi:hypothetical protein
MRPSILPSLSASLEQWRPSEIVRQLSAHFELAVPTQDALERFLLDLRLGVPFSLSALETFASDGLDRALLKSRFETQHLQVLPSELDSLASSVPETLATCIIYIANRLVPKTGTACVVTAVRNEGPWLMEWIAHYKALGFGRIIVVHNDSDDGTNEILRHLNSRGDIVAVRNEVAGSTSPQKKAFNAALHLLGELHAFEWTAFLDADEFLIPLLDNEASIAGIISEIDARAKNENTEKVEAILLHWKWYASPEQFEWKQGSVIERFSQAMPNEHVKSLVRTSNVWSMSRLHVPTLISSGRVVDSGGFTTRLSEQISPACYGVAQINHYFAKSFQEFALKKSRGRGALGLAGPQRDFENFLWGAQGLSEATMFDSNKKKKQLQLFMEDQELARLALASENTSREKVRRLEDEINLKKVHWDLTQHLTK